MTFAGWLAQTKSLTKARRGYMRERRWRDEDWYRQWELGLADEVVAALGEGR